MQDKEGMSGWAFVIVAIVLIILLTLVLASFTKNLGKNKMAVYNQPPGDSVSISRAEFDESGYVVIYDDTRLSKENVLGRSDLISGPGENITISLKSKMLAGNILYAAQHVDDGDGIYEGPEIDKAIISNGKELIVSFKVVNSTKNELPKASSSTDYSGEVEYIEPSSTYFPDQAVSLYNFNFSPSNLSIEQGDIVEFKNTEGGHSVTINGTGIDYVLDIGSIIYLKFNKPGVYEVYCKFHSASERGMKAMITVS